MVLTCMTGDLGCHSEDTKVLTPNGIKDWREINVGDIILGVDRFLRIVPTRVKQKFIYDYNGPMCLIKSKRYNFLVTPNHRMLFRKRWRPCFEYITAGEIISKREGGYLPVSLWNDGAGGDEFGISIKWYPSCHTNYSIVPYSGKVWCFETDTGNFFTFRDGKIGLSGNSGKTLAAVYLSLRHFFMKGRKIYSNINLYGIPFYRIDSLDDLNRIRDGYFLGDEFWQYAFARLSRNVMTRVSSIILLKSRKRELTVCTTAQSFEQLDKYVRNITDFIVLPVLSGDGLYCKLLWFYGGKKPKYYRSMYFQTIMPMICYNSWEEAPNFKIKDEKEEPEFCFFLPTENPATQKLIKLYKEKYKMDMRNTVIETIKILRDNVLEVLKTNPQGFTQDEILTIKRKLDLLNYKKEWV